MSAPGLSDLGGLSAPLAKLVETCSVGIGQLALPWQIKRTAKADAEAMRIISRAMNDVEGDLEYKTQNFTITMRNNTSGVVATKQVMDQATIRQGNITDVVKRATDILETKENVSSDPVDKDWAVRFFSIVQDISNDELKTLWAKVLAGEIERPSSFSLRTLELLRNITSKEARIIQKYFQFCVKSQSEEICIIGGTEFLKLINTPVADIGIIKELNLLGESGSFILNDNQSMSFLKANGKNEIRITKLPALPGVGYPIVAIIGHVPFVRLSTIGTEIFSLIHIEKTFDLSLLNMFLSQTSKWLVEDLEQNITDI